MSLIPTPATATTTILHTLHDGSILRTMSSKELVTIPVWQGNRTLDPAHAAIIAAAVGSHIQKLDSGYRIICYPQTTSAAATAATSPQQQQQQQQQQRYLLDGQHRAHVLREYYAHTLCAEDFPVVLTETTVDSELEAIGLFNAINNTKAQSWDTDPRLIANEYVAALETAFNHGRPRSNLLIRPSATKRPYLSANKLRDALVDPRIKLHMNRDRIREFVAAVIAHNDDLLRRADILMLGETNASNLKFWEAGVANRFLLAVDPRLPWVHRLMQ